jgi:hypothetical protein
VRRKKDLAELLIDVKLLRRKLAHSLAKLDKRIESLEALVVQSSSTVSAFSARVAKEIDQLENVRKRIYVLDVLLEMLEIRLETVISLGTLVESLRPVVSALKECPSPSRSPWRSPPTSTTHFIPELRFTSEGGLSSYQQSEREDFEDSQSRVYSEYED